jgi:hypothetical protein
MAARTLTNSTEGILAGQIMNMRLHIGEDDPTDLVYSLYFPQNGPLPTNEQEVGAAKHFVKILCDSIVQEYPPPNSGGSRYRRKSRYSKTRRSRR